MTFAKHQPETKDDFDGDQVRLQLQEIARAEIGRHRRRLGPLTAEQQSAVEELLIATADQISDRLIHLSKKCPTDRRAQYLNLWNPQVVA